LHAFRIHMQHRKLKIVFMGTPEFAVGPLQALHEAGYPIVGVITAPDKPAGRGMKLQESAVKQFATRHQLRVLQPEKLKNPTFLEELKSLNADIQVVVAFRMLPEVVWNMPPLGTINLHASLLPQYRGAAPINWAIINGEKESGVTTFKLQHDIDTGNILFSQRVPITENETAGELHDALRAVGAELVVRTIDAIEAGTAKEQPQPKDNSALRHAPKIFTEDCRIDWNKSLDEVYNLIRGLSPYPAAFTTLGDKNFRIFKATREHIPVQTETGNHLTDGQYFLKFACKDGYLSVTEVQMEGKKKMNIADFLRGWRPAPIQ